MYGVERIKYNNYVFMNRRQPAKGILVHAFFA